MLLFLNNNRYILFFFNGLHMSPLFARDFEQETFKKLLHSKKAEFIAIYGRRRIGKTYLVRTFFEKANCVYLEFTGQYQAPTSTQLENFSEKLAKYFHNGAKLLPPTSYKEAFKDLTKHIEPIVKKKKVLIFLDELPWFATPKSGLVSSLDYIWNTEWSRFTNLKLVVCGSAASWMLKNIVYAKGGLHNRLTHQMWLRPFYLRETKNYLKAKKIILNEQQCLEHYMVTGGVPFYLDAILPNQSASENIDELCFTKNGLLFQEFEKLIKSLYKKPKAHIELLSIIAKHRYGIGQTELIKKTKSVSSGGTFNKKIEELIAGGFIQKFIPHLNKKKEQYFKLIDEFVQFHFSWIKTFDASELHISRKNKYWLKKINTPQWHTWAGLSFEAVCYKHISEIKKALNLEHTDCVTSTWRTQADKHGAHKGAQIDLLFNRADNIIMIGELKYANKLYTIDKKTAENIAQKIAVFKEKTNTKKQIFVFFITPYGVTKNIYHEQYVHKEVVLKDLFKAVE